MNNNEQEWNDIVKSWQSADYGVVSESHPSDDVLMARVKSSVRSEMVKTTLGVAMALGVGGYVLREIIVGLPSTVDYVLYCAMLTMFLLVAVFSISLRRGGWRAQSRGTVAYLSLLLRQADAAVKITRMGKIFSAAIIGLFYALAAWVVVHMFMSENSIARPGLASLIMGVVTVFFPAMIVSLHRTQKKFVARRSQLESMLEDLR